ncbi:hypothetical protein [Pedobacter sp. L105]|uniref:hypothetical protein n=1 Tax=Pedobacter sp. L105 TaxID=1641871 RepID=UPI00131B0D91|nr:hypothetical protein [Pedobacter sp. L105]
MKIFKNWHLVKVRMIPMHSISSYYFNKVREEHSDEESCLLKRGFEDGYAQSLMDGGVSPKDLPKGKREQ